MTNSNLECLTKSDEIQSIINPDKLEGQKHLHKKNTIKSLKALTKLDLYAAEVMEEDTMAQVAR